MAEKKKWVRSVKTVSTHPPRGLFTKDAQTIARTMASQKVSPKGIGSGIRMIQYFINRAGKNLPPTRKRELEMAKRLQQEKARKDERAPAKRPANGPPGGARGILRRGLAILHMLQGAQHSVAACPCHRPPDGPAEF